MVSIKTSSSVRDRISLCRFMFLTRAGRNGLRRFPHRQLAAAQMLLRIF